MTEISTRGHTLQEVETHFSTQNFNIILPAKSRVNRVNQLVSFVQESAQAGSWLGNMQNGNICERHLFVKFL